MLAGMLSAPPPAIAAGHGLLPGLLPGGQLGYVPAPAGSAAAAATQWQLQQTQWLAAGAAVSPSAALGMSSAMPYVPPVVHPDPLPALQPQQGLLLPAADDAAFDGRLQAHTPGPTPAAAAAAAAAGTVPQTMSALEGPAPQDWLLLPSSQPAAALAQASPSLQHQPYSPMPFSSPGLFDEHLPRAPWDLPGPEQLPNQGYGLYSGGLPIGRVSEAGEVLDDPLGEGLDVDLLFADDGGDEAAADDLLQGFAAATAAGAAAATAAEACRTAAGVPVCFGTGDSGAAGGSHATSAAAAAAAPAAAAATAAATGSGRAGSGRLADGAGMAANAGSGSNIGPQFAAAGSQGHGSTANTAGYVLSTTEASAALSSSSSSNSSSSHGSTRSSSVANTVIVLQLLKSPRQLFGSDTADKGMPAALPGRGPAAVAKLLAGKDSAKALLRLQQQHGLESLGPVQVPGMQTLPGPVAASKGMVYSSESSFGLQALVAGAAEGAGRARSLPLGLPSAPTAAGFEEEHGAGEWDMMKRDAPAPMWEAAATAPAAAASPGAEAAAGRDRAPVLPELPQLMEHWPGPQAVLLLMTWLLSYFAAHRWLNMAVLQMMQAVAATQLLLQLFFQQVVANVPLLRLLQAERQLHHQPQGGSSLAGRTCDMLCST